ncbi:MAG TPA: SpoIIE family protein phosphatase, partial [Candidatus Binatia bacterium]|nr:SpoIIE family protein phosphatase [Candidatus Binatia bacterium]
APIIQRMDGSPPPPGEISAAPARYEKGPHLRVLAVNIFVRDQERSLQFYREQLGFDLAFDARLQSGERWVAVSPPDGSAVLTLIAPPPDSEEYKLIGQPTPVVFVTEDVAAKYSEWRKRGVRFRHTPRLRRVSYERQSSASGSPAASSPLEAHAPVWGGVFTRFEDIDRNSFALVSFDEVTREVEARRRALAERLESERRVAQELEIAKNVQARLFPQAAPALRTLEYAGACIPARQVGGDYYDFLSLGQDRLGLVVGDVSGKGIAAALLMANLQANLRSQCAMAADEPQRLLGSVNQLFCENTTDSAYATLFFAEYDDQSRRLRYANCGHLTGLLLRGDGAVERLAATGTVLGLFADWECTTEELVLFSGDTLLLYTDGVTESFNQSGEEFGEQRLVEALRRHLGSSSQALLGAIVDEVRRFSPREQHDDITLVVARCRGAEEKQMSLIPSRGAGPAE